MSELSRFNSDICRHQGIVNPIGLTKSAIFAIDVADAGFTERLEDGIHEQGLMADVAHAVGDRAEQAINTLPSFGEEPKLLAASS